MRVFSICAAVCLTMLPGRAGAELEGAAKAAQGSGAVAEAVYYPPQYGERWQQPWTRDGYRRWQPQAPYQRYAPYGWYGDRRYGGYQPRYGDAWRSGRPAWPSQRYAQRPWPSPSQQGYWNRTPDYRWAGTARSRNYAYGPGYQPGYQEWRQQWRW